jgi:hypothetical protein
MAKLRLPLALLLLLAVSVHAPHAEDKTPAKVEPKTYNFLYYYMGARIGWAKTTVNETELDGRKVMLEHEEAWLQIKRSFDGASFETEGTTDTWSELDGSLIRVVDVMKNGKQEIKLESVYEADKVRVIETVDGGKPNTTNLEKGDRLVYGDSHAWRVLKDHDRVKAGDTLKFHSVDADDHALVEQSWTVNGRVTRKLGDKSTVEGVEIRIVRAGRAGTVIMGDDDMPLLYEDVGGFSLERTDKIPDPFEPERVSMRNSMDANVAIVDCRQLTRMDISFDYEHDDDADIPKIADSNDYHQVIRHEKGYALRLKSTKLTREFESPKYPMADIPEDMQKYLNPTAMCQSDDETLVAEALKLAKGKKTALEVARAAMRFANSHLKSGSGETGSASARQAYDECTGDCTEHAALFVALARAAGLPARNVGGFVYACSEDGKRAIFGYHAWAEVWLGRWVPVDPTVEELGTSARYVMFDIDEPGETYGHGRSSRCIRQDIKPIIDGYELAGGKIWQRKGATEFEWE